MAEKLVSIDAETKAIEHRPNYPPKSVGYAIWTGRKGRYWAFGHPTNNNCTKREAVRAVKAALQEGKPVFHNSEFDLEVMAKDGIRYRGEYHDTMRTAFLNEPRSQSLALKTLAEEYLDMPPDEQDLLKAWILNNVKEAKRKPTTWGAYISEAPGDLVGRYAVGDVKRTIQLHRLLHPSIVRRGMAEAYEREMKIIPIKTAMEQGGIRLRWSKLKKDVPKFRKLHSKVEKQIIRRLRCDPNINLGSSKQLADALYDADLMSEEVLTAKGNRSTKRSVLEEVCTDPKLVELLSVHGVLSTYLSTFLGRWLEDGEYDGYIYPSFNTVRGTDEYGGGKMIGTRTGRFSSSNPNFQNIPANVLGSKQEAVLLKIQRALRSMGTDFVGLRDYFAPDPGCVFIGRDYSQQELRILAHFEAGVLCNMYDNDPTMDVHEAIRQLVMDRAGLDFPRKFIKEVNFGIIYAMGIPKMAGRIGIGYDECRVLKRSILSSVPGVKKLNRKFKRDARLGLPFYTWGGREYFCEEPIYINTPDGKVKKDLAYKMINTEIQGSAADCTKEGMINVSENFRHARLVLQVHDELLASCPKEHAKKEMQRMKEGMEDVDFAVPMLTDGSIGATSWARMRKTE